MAFRSESLDSFIIFSARDAFEAFSSLDGGRKDLIDGAFQCLGDFKEWAVTEVLALHLGFWNPSSSFCKAMMNSIDWDEVFEAICKEHNITIEEEKPIEPVKMKGDINQHIHYLKYLPTGIEYELPYETETKPVSELKVGDVISKRRYWETEDIAITYKVVRINKKTISVLDCTGTGAIVTGMANHISKLDKMNEYDIVKL